MKQTIIGLALVVVAILIFLAFNIVPQLLVMK